MLPNLDSEFLIDQMHPVIPSPYVFLEARSVLEGAGFVMSMTEPFNLGRVLTFRDNDSYLSSMGNSTWPVVTIPGYRILIQFSGSVISGRRLILEGPDMGAIHSELAGMSGFYYQEKIVLHPKHYRRYML